MIKLKQHDLTNSTVLENSKRGYTSLRLGTSIHDYFYDGNQYMIILMMGNILQLLIKIRRRNGDCGWRDGAADQGDSAPTLLSKLDINITNTFFCQELFIFYHEFKPPPFQFASDTIDQHMMSVDVTRLSYDYSSVYTYLAHYYLISIKTFIRS